MKINNRTEQLIQEKQKLINQLKQNTYPKKTGLPI